MPLEFEIEGLSEITGLFESFVEDFKANMRKRMEEAAWIILEESNEKVPVDTGKLRRSGFVRVEGDSVFISYSVNYALAVHERTEVQHDNGEAKFLEKAMDANADLIEEKIMAAFQDTLG